MKIAAIPRRFVRHDWGGTETVVLETSRALQAAGHQVDVLTPSVFSDVREEDVEGVRVRRFPYVYPFFGLSSDDRTRLDKKGGNLFSWQLLRALMRATDVDLIHLHTLKRLGGIGRYVARRRGIPYVVSLHGGVLDVPAEEAADVVAPIEGKVEWGRALGWWLGSRRVLDDAAAIICVGGGEEQRMREKFPDKRVLFLPNGVDTRRFAEGDGPGFRSRHGIPQDAELILAVGRIDPQKNQTLAVDALQQLAARRKNVHLALVGHVTSEGYEDKLRARIREHGLESRVTLIPGLDARDGDLVGAYHAADVFLLPSIHEPFGIVILEAWAAGVPVVASRVGGVPSFVEDGRDGLLFESGDLDEACRHLATILDDPARGRDIGVAGRNKARETYDWSIITSQLEEVYQEVRGAHPVC